MSRLVSYRGYGRRGLTVTELVVVVVLSVVLLAVFSIFLPQRHRGETAYRVKCASNLRQIGQAMLLYANENRGAYPRGLYTAGPVVVPVVGTNASASNPFAADGPVNDVTAAMFLLLRTQEITSEVFNCPISAQERWDYGGGSKTAQAWSNWKDWKKNVSYSMHNPYVDNDFLETIRKDQSWSWSNRISAEFALAGDINPGVGKETVNLLTVTTASSSREMRSANSPNHDFDGQNVLFGDGHVEFVQNPFVGVQGDNIYVNTKGTVYGSMQNAKDSVLLPAAE